MTKATHTPAPWHIGEHGISGLHVLVFGEDGWLVASASPNIKMSAKTAVANAMLISAAPDLFSALEDVLACYDDDGNLVAAQDQDSVAFEKARAAIAKAKGE